MFSILSERLEAIYAGLKSRGKLKEVDVDKALREIRSVFLEADVSLPVIGEFLADVREKAIGQEVLASITPGHQMVKIVNDELKALLGDDNAKIHIAQNPPTVILMAGLQGSGKTTTVGKLAKKFKDDGKKCLLVPADVYRPAAIEQLKILGAELEVEVYLNEKGHDPVTLCSSAVEKAISTLCNYVIIDTAGRLQTDNVLMEELKAIKLAIQPHETLFVADSMMGQQAVNVAKTFNEAIEIDGIVLTKMDGDAKGGAALAIKKVTGKPIKFIGVGEKLEALEPFYPERVVSRIIGMGDVLSLVEKAERAYEGKQQDEIEKKFRKNQFTLDDFRDQLKQIQKMGSFQQLLSMIPGTNKLKGLKVDERAFVKIEAIISSMTPLERERHKVINGSRKRRIASGSGTSINEVNKLLKQFSQMQKMMKKMTSGKFKGGLDINSLTGGRRLSPY